MSDLTSTLGAMSTPTLRPVVALDVDGVLNADGLPDEHTISISPDDQPKSPFLRGGGTQEMSGIVRIDPAVGPWITALLEHADVVWATTWEKAANVGLAPLLGIDPLPVACAVAEHPPRFGYVKNGDSVAWKASVLRELYPGRPLVWADDGAWAYSRVEDYDEDNPSRQPWYDWRVPPVAPWLSKYAIDEDDDRPEAAPSLVVTPDARVGLTAADREAISAFVADPYGFVHPGRADLWAWHDETSASQS